MTAPQKKSRKSHGYRLAVPISEETMKVLHCFCGPYECSLTEAARWLLEAAADLYASGELEVTE